MAVSQLALMQCLHQRVLTLRQARPRFRPIQLLKQLIYLCHLPQSLFLVELFKLLLRQLFVTRASAAHAFEMLAGLAGLPNDRKLEEMVEDDKN